MTDNIPNPPDQPIGRSDMPFLAHIEELRWRLIKAVLAVVAGTAVGLYFSDYIFHFFVRPLGDIKLHFTEITGSFYAYLKIGIYFGIVVAVPVIFYQLWQFVAPGLYRREKSKVIPLVLIATILFLGGAAFCYLLVLPFAIQYLVGFGQDIMTPIITIESYISFAGIMIIAFGFSFELPVLGYMAGKMGIISGRGLSKGRPYAVVIILIAAAILTPTPDVVSQLLLAGPLLVLYEITIVLVRLTGKKK